MTGTTTSSKRSRSLSPPSSPPTAKRRSLRLATTQPPKTSGPSPSDTTPETSFSETTAETSSLKSDPPLSPTTAPPGRTGGIPYGGGPRDPLPRQASTTYAARGAASITAAAHAAGTLPSTVVMPAAPTLATGHRAETYGTRAVVITNDKERMQTVLRLDNLQPVQAQFVEWVLRQLDNVEMMEEVLESVG
ncbi:hypothetical protein LTR36_007835 [Oleoguttula mirabilis]|uniref:Uncharacterized protein n=1 Tax=Oleoguttula mirabilis TaxID=1507867 RepID=A0AAV9JAW6_9PEZI|nr:hypothetical protein LTR36_007835 [Oleoguttula mirabilis]